MRISLRSGTSSMVVLCASVLAAQSAPSISPDQTYQVQPSKAEQLFALGNQARVAEGVGRLEWDASLADAALTHCLRMAVEGPISHQYAGEQDLTSRAGAAGV